MADSRIKIKIPKREIDKRDIFIWGYIASTWIFQAGLLALLIWKL